MIIEKAEFPPESEVPYVPEKTFGTQGVPQLLQEQPPPYEGGSRSGVSSPAPTPTSPRIHSIFQSASQQHVNFITLESKHNEISGSYIVNPEIPGSAAARTRVLDRRERKKLRHNIVPNASFNTKHGRINLNLATAGNTEQPGKAYIQVVTRDGRVNVNLFALQANKNIFLEIISKHGSINLLIPPSFNGLFRISTSRHGRIQFLREFAERARVIFADDEHADVLFGTGDLSHAEPTSEGIDYCSLTTHNGCLTLGVSGVDPIDTSSPSSLMKKLGAMVLGPDLMRTVDTLRAELLREHGTLATPHQTSV
ncbi:uncharacterized protein PHACADRAFT_264103 [Phanerochaete carnosa HHB-10118-sp]|uniref:DUF7330 domain-containing protein n=1 Tax=Phanerochaete carnosa (strain HHB-10118-sp) TaxID=650164 RepID=K5WK96_PHACS|nr:uncharacterized protein PHACADRAFT_264103 [Phanerochaete carnosa HHB-10118-sp]EKM50692.1 hypothetical protein PHACADRAFT_264103 [Phanerochaete carnosa HHB-10118-sp]